MNALILGCIFLFVTSIIASAGETETSSQLSGPQPARVIVPRAIVYSDENMNSPLGFISNDKLIYVGSARKKNPDLLPLVVYGRLAFIEAKNIHYENASAEQQSAKRGAPREHNIDIVLAKPEENLSANNSAYFQLQRFSPGIQTQDVLNAVEGSSDYAFTGFGISFIHRQLVSRYFWGASYEYNKLSAPSTNFTFYSIAPILGYTPIKNPVFLVDLTFAFDIALSSVLKIENNYAVEPSAFLWGPQLAARIVFFPTQKYHAFGILGYRNYSVSGIEQLEDPNSIAINGITKINGISFSLGLAMEL